MTLSIHAQPDILAVGTPGPARPCAWPASQECPILLRRKARHGALMMRPPRQAGGARQGGLAPRLRNLLWRGRRAVAASYRYARMNALFH